ncbi:hypothetical protein QM012_000073 [Aureobasidium pullulans]|uniref:Uncharacterized protein n=1 Tax=Aureobasidium pullulans TaxID=5580 RepID=A0ABR0TWA1_AURPU
MVIAAPGHLLPEPTKATSKKLKNSYAQYAQNIDIRWLQVDFTAVGTPMDVHGDNKSQSGTDHTDCHSVSMRTSDGKNKVWVYRGPGIGDMLDTFEVPDGTKEETLRIMLERATGLDAAGNKVKIAAQT